MAERRAVLLRAARGLGVAVLATLAGMALLAGAVMIGDVSDDALLALNQALKILSILLGALAAVGLGGRRGLALGALVGLLYMVLGYGLYCLLDGKLAPPALLASEFALGTLAGALSGALAANLKPLKSKRRARTA